GDLAGTLNYQHLLHEAFHEITRLPTVAAGKLEQTGQLSGVALSILYGPLVELTEAKRRSYGPMLCELGRRVLELSGIRGVTPTVPWPEVVPHDPEGEAAMYEAHKRLGVSKHT